MKRSRVPDACALRYCAVGEIAAALEPRLRNADAETLRRWLREQARSSAKAAPARWQDAWIEREIPAGAKVLDLGCGGGELLSRLMREKKVRGQGVEIDPAAVMRCVALDVPVLQSDLDDGLQGFADGRFDFVILEETVQTLRHPLRVLNEMLRVGRHGIVSFPNFGYWRVRLALALEGRMPVTERLPYRWHDTPNIHLFTLRDLLDWADEAGVRIVRGYSLVEGEVRPLSAEDNLRAEEALLVLARRRGARKERQGAAARRAGDRRREDGGR